MRARPDPESRRKSRDLRVDGILPLARDDHSSVLFLTPRTTLVWESSFRLFLSHHDQHLCNELDKPRDKSYPQSEGIWIVMIPIVRR